MKKQLTTLSILLLAPGYVIASESSSSSSSTPAAATVAQPTLDELREKFTQTKAPADKTALEKQLLAERIERRKLDAHIIALEVAKKKLVATGSSEKPADNTAYANQEGELVILNGQRAQKKAAIKDGYIALGEKGKPASPRQDWLGWALGWTVEETEEVQANEAAAAKE